MVDVLDVDWALLDAGTASGARPQCIGINHGTVVAAVSPGVVTVGVAVQGWIASVDAFLDFLGAVTVACGRLALGRARFRGSDLTLILQQAGAEALPIVSLIAPPEVATRTA